VAGSEVFALKEIGVEDAVGISRKAAKPLVVSYLKEKNRMPFGNDTFDFVFSGRAGLDASSRPLDLAVEIARTMKPKGYLVVHVKAKDTYSFHSFLDLFNCFEFIKSRSMDGFDSSLPGIKEIVMQKREGSNSLCEGNSVIVNKKCSTPSHKRELVQKAEPLIKQEPLKPWLTLKKNVKNVKYLPAMVDISFRSRYVYVDVGARSYGSSIASWFKKQYPKQNKTFDIYAIEADKHFHEDYKLKKGVKLLPYAAWVKNETLMFEINGDPGKQVVDKGRGMGRIKPADLKFAGDGAEEKIQGFDFAEWMKSAVMEKDYVVMKMDVEGTEFDLIPRLFETGAICLIDELFLECHYNRWQRCCPGQRSEKYEKTYDQCLELFTSLRESGVLVHQWW
jgi:FkbM family methyltransferase